MSPSPPILPPRSPPPISTSFPSPILIPSRVPSPLPLPPRCKSSPSMRWFPSPRLETELSCYFQCQHRLVLQIWVSSFGSLTYVAFRDGGSNSEARNRAEHNRQLHCSDRSRQGKVCFLSSVFRAEKGDVTCGRGMDLRDRCLFHHYYY